MASGAIATLTFFDVPELQSQPASRSLPAMRWLFSRGSHTFPSASLLSGVGFVYSAYGISSRSFLQLGDLGSNSSRVNGFLLAALLAFSIAPFTALMIPTNFAIIEANEKLGGSRSQEAPLKSDIDREEGKRNVGDSIAGKGEAGEFTDLSGPQERTARDSTAEEDRKARELLERFRWLNLVRSILIGAGGVVGISTALSASAC